MGHLPGLPLCAVWVSFADELVLELGELVEQHGQWRLRVLHTGWGLTSPGGTALFPRPLADGEAWGSAATRAFDSVERTRIESLSHGDDWHLRIRFGHGHVFVIEPDGGAAPDWRLSPAGDGPWVEGGPGRRVALVAADGERPLEEIDGPLGLIA
jgi:class 3 adenylate cyclase